MQLPAQHPLVKARSRGKIALHDQIAQTVGDVLMQQTAGDFFRQLLIHCVILHSKKHIVQMLLLQRNMLSLNINL